MRIAFRLVTLSALALAAVYGPPASAQSGKLLLTGGVSSIDGAAGGGLTPWAVTGSYATAGERGFTAYSTRVVTNDYALSNVGVAASFDDRYEISLAGQQFNAGAAVPDATLKQIIVGGKVRVMGNAILDSDTWMPQIAAGIEFKRADPGSAVGAIMDSVSAKRRGTDVYVSATKLLLGQSVLLNGTLRATKANQNGLLGFGSVDDHKYHLMPELSVAMLLRKDLVIGAEYRAKPDNLAFAGAGFREDAWRDLFVAWAPSKHFSLTVAAVNLGNIVGQTRQRGAYVSGQLAF